MLLASGTAPLALTPCLMGIVFFSGGLLNDLLFVAACALGWIAVTSLVGLVGFVFAVRWAMRAIAGPRIVLTRHHLDWMGRQVPLEAVRAVRQTGPLAIELADETLTLRQGLEAEPESLARFRAALTERLATLDRAEERPEARHRLAQLAAGKRAKT